MRYGILDAEVRGMTGKPTYAQQADEMIKMTARLLTSETGRQLSALSRGEFGILMYLAEHDGGVTSTLIGESLGIGAGGVANVLKTLEKKGLVSKAQDQRDKRANCVTITPEGRQLLERRYSRISQSLAGCLKSMSSDESASLRAGLRRLLQTVQTEEERKGIR